MDYLADSSWLPPPIDPRWVLGSIESERYESCVGRLFNETMVDTNVVERLAITHGLLFREPGGGGEPLPMLVESLESLGFAVSASFAESGADALDLIRTIVSLESGQALDGHERLMAYDCLGRLWAAAATAPAGYAHFISRSAYGAMPPGEAFFRAATDTTKLAPEDEARYLRRLVDMLQAGIETKELPAATVGRKLGLTPWRAPAWAIYLMAPNGKRWRLEVHVREESLGPGTTRYTVKLVEDLSGTAVASIRAVVMEGESGSYDDFITQSEVAGTTCERIVNAVFAPKNAVGISPRVRWLLEAAGDRLFKLAVVEGMYAESPWRQRDIGRLMLEQLLVESDMVDVLIGRPTPFEPADSTAAMPMGLQAGYAMASLSLARHFARMGAEYLVSGVMGMRVTAIQNLHASGTKSRMG